MASAALAAFPVMLSNSEITDHEVLLQWKVRIQRKFQNSRKRQDSTLTEVVSRKKKKTPGPTPTPNAPATYGIINYLPSTPESEDDMSIKRHAEWLATEWRKREPDLEKVRVVLLFICIK